MRLSVSTAAAFGSLNVTSAVPSAACAAAGATSAAAIRHAHVPFQPLIDLPLIGFPPRDVPHPSRPPGPCPGYARIRNSPSSRLSASRPIDRRECGAQLATAGGIERGDPRDPAQHLLAFEALRPVPHRVVQGRLEPVVLGAGDVGAR